MFVKLVSWPASRQFVGSLSAVGLFLSLTLAPAVASAQGSAAAEALFQQGRSLLAEGKTAEACGRFAQSQKLEPKLGTLLNLATCHEQMGLHATAWAEFTSAATLARREGQVERETFAREHVAALEAKMSTLLVRPPPETPGLAVTLDGQPFTALDAPLPIDPGDHVLEVTAPGRKPWSTSVKVAADKSALEVAIPALEVDPASTAAPPVAGGPPTTPPPAAEEDGGVPAVAIVGFTIGGVGLLVGGITGIIAITQGSDVSDACTADGDDLCRPGREADDLSSANAIANVSNVSFLVGLAGVGVGLGALLLAGDDAPRTSQPPTAPTVEPVVGLGSLGARGRF
jgi:hypothetical protein